MRETIRRPISFRSSPLVGWSAAWGLCLLAGVGCALLGVKEQREAVERLVRIRGEVRTETPREGPLVVVLLRPMEGPADTGPEAGATDYVLDHYVLDGSGSFVFAASPGRFALAAFLDRNANLICDPEEPLLADQPPFELAEGASLDGVELVIPDGSPSGARYDVRELQARTPRDQQNFSLGRFTVAGEVVDLEDPRLGPESGALGMWRFADFLFEVGPGIYFLEEYDPDRVPVLFVHGISGYPQEFTTLIDGLDRERFQPWLYFYPSGFDLEGISRHLGDVVSELRRRYRFERMAVIAHSMGGLVSRAFILQRFEATELRDVEVFVALSSPWGGEEAASLASAAREDLVVYAWADLDPQSEFLKALFYQAPDYVRARRLPSHVEFHMIFGYRRNELSLGPSGDGVLSVRSEARLEAIEEARSILPLDCDHAGILRSAEAVSRVNTILAEAFGGPSP